MLVGQGLWQTNTCERLHLLEEHSLAMLSKSGKAAKAVVEQKVSLRRFTQDLICGAGY